MSNEFNPTTAAVSTADIPYFKLRIALAVLSLMVAFLPLVSMNVFGGSQGFTLAHGIGAIAYLIPLVFVGALIVAYHPPLREHSALLDKIAAGVLVFFLLWGAYELTNLISQIAQIRSQFGGMGMPFNVSNFGDLFRVFSPSLGLVGLIGVYALGFVPAIKNRKKV